MAYKNKKLLAIIPARIGSKGIPRKNVKLLNGKPLIFYILESIIQTNLFDKIIVTTDSDEIIYLMQELNQVHCYKRDSVLAKDQVILDPVIFDAYQFASKSEDYDYIFTFQPTSPLLSKETIINSVAKIINEQYDTILSVTEDRHLRWTVINGASKALYAKRVNRQSLPITLKETGAIIACSKKIITDKTRIGKKIGLILVPEHESLDIDCYNDWLLAEALLKRPTIGFVVNGNKKVGLGHVYRTLTLANALNVEAHFFIPNQDQLAVDKIRDSNYKVITYLDQNDLISILDQMHINLLINDTLDTTQDYIQLLKQNNRFVVTFEDFGEGADYAHLTFNALYENSMPPKNHFFGYHYFCLRDEFLLSNKKVINDQVKNVLITFGGTDPNNLTQFTLNCLKDKGYQINIVLGPGYTHYSELKKSVKSASNITIYQSVDRMSEYMLNADLVITSNGRTTYEIASLGVPAISICQNERELKHLFGHLTKTIINLGLYSNVSKENLLNTFNELVEDLEKRKRIHGKMLKLHLQDGTVRVIKLILEKYNQCKNNRNLFETNSSLRGG